MSADRSTTNTSTDVRYQIISIDDLRNLFSYCKELLSNKEAILSFIRGLGAKSFSAEMIIDKMMDATECDSIYLENIPSDYLEINLALRPIHNAVQNFIHNEIANNGILMRDVNNPGNFQLVSNEVTNEAVNVNNQSVKENTNQIVENTNNQTSQIVENTNNQTSQQSKTEEIVYDYSPFKMNKLLETDFDYLCSLFEQKSIDYKLAEITKEIFKSKNIIKRAELNSQIALKLCAKVTSEGRVIKIYDKAPDNDRQAKMTFFSELSKKVSGKMAPILDKLVKLNSLTKEGGKYKVRDENIDSVIDEVIKKKRFYGGSRKSNKTGGHINNNNQANKVVKSDSSNKKRHLLQNEEQEQNEKIKHSRNDNASSAVEEETAAVTLSGFKTSWRHPISQGTGTPEDVEKVNLCPEQNRPEV